MIPTKTLRERMTEALTATLPKFGPPYALTAEIEHMVQAAIAAVGDPCLIDTADSLEPTWTFRADDDAHGYIWRWANENRMNLDDERFEAAHACADAMLKWPD